MDILEALKTAIEYEKRVAATYASAVDVASDPVGIRIFKLMAEEEGNHVSYLQSKLEGYESGGTLSSEDLGTRLPPIDKIKDAAKSLDGALEGADFTSELDMLKRARALEMETSDYYHRLVDELPAEGRAFFQRFVEIEDGHVALVEAELEYLQHKGAWLSVDDGDLRYF